MCVLRYVPLKLRLHFVSRNSRSDSNIASQNTRLTREIDITDKDAGTGHVAILLAVKDGARFLQQQLESFTRQTHTNWSLHVSDDGSGDDTLAIVQEFQKHCKNPVTVRRGPCTGSSRNFLSLVGDDDIQADFFAFSDQDDVWYPEKLERALRVLDGARLGQPALYCARTELIDDQGEHIGFSTNFRKAPGFRNALVQSIAGGNTMVFNAFARELLSKVVDNNIVVHDWMTYIAVSAVGGAVFYDQRPTVKYRQHDGNLVGSNLGFRARLLRLKLLFRGKWEEWNTLHFVVLKRLSPEMTRENRHVLAEFLKIRRAKQPLRRLRHLWQSGVYRQTAAGQVGLLVAAIFNKL